MAPRKRSMIRARRQRHLFENWESVARRLRAARRIALFLDFDGTLTPIRHHPHQVSLSVSTRRLLKRLANRPRIAVYVISGRRAADVRKHVKVSGVTCVGLHGWDRAGKPREKAPQNFIARLRRKVESALADLEGVWVEDKFIIFVVHYRRASGATVRRARAILREIVATARSKVRVMEGKKVWEVLPREVKGKGAAVRALLAELKGRPLPIYVGDDTTDEAAFAALPRGLTIRVGFQRPTRARFELRNPAEVREFLKRLEAEIA
jgi:trehalose-phosphatase